MERTYICANGVMEKTRYLVGANAKPREKRKAGNTSFRKQEANFNSAVRTVARYLNCNCNSSGYLITLHYDDESVAGIADSCGGDMDQAWANADNELKRWFRKVKRAFKIDFGLYVTSDMDGDTGELVRPHHHIVLMGDVSLDKLETLWKNGTINIRRLRNQPDYTQIAVYMLRQIRHEKDKKRYHITRGAKKPRLEEREVLTNAPIEAPNGATVCEHHYSEEQVAQYIRYIPKKQEIDTRSKDVHSAKRELGQ